MPAARAGRVGSGRRTPPIPLRCRWAGGDAAIIDIPAAPPDDRGGLLWQSVSVAAGLRPELLPYCVRSGRGLSAATYHVGLANVATLEPESCRFVRMVVEVSTRCVFATARRRRDLGQAGCRRPRQRGGDGGARPACWAPCTSR